MTTQAETIRMKTAIMTDKQILSECKPRALYYSNTQGKRQARPCILCGTTIIGKFADLEQHALTVDVPAYEEEYTRPR